MVLGSRGVYGVVFWPQSGEFANSTNFLTADDYRKRLEFLATPSHSSDVAMFTDGLETAGAAIRQSNSSRAFF